MDLHSKIQKDPTDVNLKLSLSISKNTSVVQTSVEEPVELENIPEFIKILQQIPIDMIKTDPPSEDEIKNVLKKLKNGKAANDITAEIFKYAHQSPELIAEMEKLFDIIWKTYEIPQSFRHSKLIALWKGASKGSPKNPKTYKRPSSGIHPM